MIHNQLNKDAQCSSVAESNAGVLEHTYSKKTPKNKELNIYIPI